MVHVSLTFRHPYCAFSVINHFFCDIPPLLALSCPDTHINELLLVALRGTIQTTFYCHCYLLHLHSHHCFEHQVFRRKKQTFSTCASHFTSVTLFYGILLMYLCPTATYSPEIDKVVSLFYTVVFPMLNTMIYSFRNKDV